jgi:hypothetical protein
MMQALVTSGRGAIVEGGDYAPGAEQFLDRLKGVRKIQVLYRGDSVLEGFTVVEGSGVKAYSNAAQIAGTDPRNCVVVEMYRSRAQAAVNAGMRVLGVQNGQNLGPVNATVDSLDSVTGHLFDGLFKATIVDVFRGDLGSFERQLLKHLPLGMEDGKLTLGFDDYVGFSEYFLKPLLKAHVAKKTPRFLNRKKELFRELNLALGTYLSCIDLKGPKDFESLRFLMNVTKIDFADWNDREGFISFYVDHRSWLS